MLLVMLTILLGSCNTDYVDIEFNPDFYIGDYENEQIINELGQTVSASSPIFNSFRCLSEGKVKELADIIARARLPKKIKKKLLEALLRGNNEKFDDYFHDVVSVTIM